jgi:hypothetical protein
MMPRLGLPALEQHQTSMQPKKRKPSGKAGLCLHSPIKGTSTVHHIAPPKIEIHLPLFAWANRHRAKPFPQIRRWHVDGNLCVTGIEVIHG